MALDAGFFACSVVGLGFAAGLAWAGEVRTAFFCAADSAGMSLAGDGVALVSAVGSALGASSVTYMETKFGASGV